VSAEKFGDVLGTQKLANSCWQAHWADSSGSSSWPISVASETVEMGPSGEALVLCVNNPGEQCPGEEGLRIPNQPTISEQWKGWCRRSFLLRRWSRFWSLTLIRTRFEVYFVLCRVLLLTSDVDYSQCYVTSASIIVSLQSLASHYDYSIIISWCTNIHHSGGGTVVGA
jgi:hypothetical protein